MSSPAQHKEEQGAFKEYFAIILFHLRLCLPWPLSFTISVIQFISMLMISSNKGIFEVQKMKLNEWQAAPHIILDNAALNVVAKRKSSSLVCEGPAPCCRNNIGCVEIALIKF